LAPKIKSIPQQLDALFAGRQDCFGLYLFDGPQPAAGKKREGKAISYPNSVHPDKKLTDIDWVNHVEGRAALGIVPVQIDGTCKWFSIDVDDYTIDHAALAKKIYERQLPIVHCRSKSGGAHLYGLLSEPYSAEKCVKLARKWCSDLGFDAKKTEVFPKQVKFDSPDAKGNWIIIPYFGGDKAADFAIDDSGKKVDFKVFNQYCQARIFTPEEADTFINAKEEKRWSPDEILAQTPPCIRKMMELMLKEGDGRNNALSHLSWQFRKQDEFFETDIWQDKLDDFNQTYFDPPVSHKELTQVIKNHSKGKYVARCDVNPMVLHCDKAACLKLKFGIGRDRSYYGEIELTGVTKILTGDDPLWRVYINGQPMLIDTDTFLSPRKFKVAVLANFNIVISSMKQAEHDALIAPMIRDALVIEEAEIVSTSSKVMDTFKQWIGVVGDKTTAIESVTRGIPYVNHLSQVIIFRLQDMVLEYKRIHKEIITDREIFMYLKSMGFYSEAEKIGPVKLSVMHYKIDKDTDNEWIPKRKEEGKF
jgi:hypothetical protein